MGMCAKKTNSMCVLLLSLFVAGMAIVTTTPASAQDASESLGSNESLRSFKTAPVIIDGESIFRLRGSSSFPAATRARLISERLETIAADESINPESIALIEHDAGLAIVAGERLILVITDADAELEGLKINLLASITKERLIDAVKRYRSDRSAENLREDTKHALAAFAITLLIIICFFFGSRWLLRIVDRHYKKLTELMKIQSFEVIRANRIYAFTKGLIQFVRTLVIAGVSYVALIYVLDLFPWTRPLALELEGYVTKPLHILLGSIEDNISNLLFIAIIVIIVRFGLRITRAIFQAIERRSVRFSRFEPKWAMPTYKLIRLGVIAFALAVVYPYIPGSDSAAFRGVSIFAGVILSLGSSSVISNVIAGYTMIYRSAFDIGDWVKIGDSVGEVVDMRLLVTHLRSRKNEAIVVPNSKLMNIEVINFSDLAKSDGLILHTSVGIGYEIHWRRVEKMLLEAATRTSGLRSDRLPFVLKKSLDSFCVMYELNVYCGDANLLPTIYSDLHQNILDVFNESGVQIMTPAYEADPAIPKIAPADSGSEHASSG